MDKNIITSTLFELCKRREEEFRVQAIAYEFRLNDLNRINWISVGGGTIFPIIAGATLFTSSNNENFKIFAGILSILGACLTAIHKAFNCEAYQAECARLINDLRNLADAYENVRLDESLLPENFKKLEDRREQLIYSIKARPGQKYIEKAKRVKSKE